jgi:hypothetical protein
MATGGFLKARDSAPDRPGGHCHSRVNRAKSLIILDY